MHKASRAAHHAALVTLWLEGSMEVSITQSIKSANFLDKLLSDFHQRLTRVEEPDELVEEKDEEK